MSGLLALLDDVAALAKAAAASVDDIAAQSASAGGKTAPVLIDDAAVTPQYVAGIDPKRELWIVWKIARGSLVNKLVFLLPVAILLSVFAPWAITPLLMLGGAYLGYEGAEKIWHLIAGGHGGGPDAGHDAGHGGESGPQAGPAARAATAPAADPARLEEEKAAGAIRTDFILSAEIMTITLAVLPADLWWKQAIVLAIVGIGVTIAIYGAVALIVKADDFGLWLACKGRLAFTRAIGRGIVKAMPVVMDVLSTVGTAAMLWVGGSIIVHGLEALGLHAPAEYIAHAAESLAHMLPEGLAAAGLWLGEAVLFAIVGLAVGLVLLPLVSGVISPLWAALSGRRG